MKPIKIGLIGESDDLDKASNYPPFMKMKSDMQAALADPDFIRILCIHEAAHHYYFTRFGVDECTLDGPSITVKRSKKGCVCSANSAAIRVVSWKPEAAKRTLKQVVDQAGIAAAAGGIATKILTGRDDKLSTEGDYSNFERICKKAKCFKYCAKLWKAAQDFVTADLQDPTIQLCIRDTAETIIKPALISLL